MRFFAVLLVFAFVLAVSAAPKNVPQWSAETAAEFNEQSLGVEKRSFEGLQRELDNWMNPFRMVKRNLQSAVHAWLHPEDVLVKRDSTADGSAFGFVRDWKSTTEKKYGLVPREE